MVFDGGFVVLDPPVAGNVVEIVFTESVVESPGEEGHLALLVGSDLVVVDEWA